MEVPKNDKTTLNSNFTVSLTLETNQISLTKKELEILGNEIEGEVYDDVMMQVIYATDASVYRELPAAIVIPKSVDDIRKVIAFANEYNQSIIPRAAGTSLAGQCVGDGIVVDVSKYLTKILEYNEAESWVRVQPGVIRDQLNDFLKAKGRFFSPITSTANRATIGGMVGNNSCGTTSIQYGSTRDHVIEINAILYDGSEVVFKELTETEYQNKLLLQNTEGEIYRQIDTELSNEVVRKRIIDSFPKASIHRRNTGYAIDYLLQMNPFDKESTKGIDLCKLICGSEGTLAFITEIKLHLDHLPPSEVLVVAAHFQTLSDSMKATQIAMKHNPSLCELVDKIILDCTKTNKEQAANRFFVKGDPAAVLMVEFRADDLESLDAKANGFINEMESYNSAYAFTKTYGEKTKKIWALRSAGLGLLSNIPGDKKAVACIEDTAVDLDDLPEYIEEFTKLMEGFGQRAVYYAHAGAGELHLRPILDLKKKSDVQDFHDITLATAKLVKKYKGSFSGEHGDGRVRASFIPLLVGEENYQLFREIKQTWDPKNIFNPGKIVDAIPMTESLRYEVEVQEKEISSVFDFSDTGGILRAAEKCNGSGDCRKLPESGGTMCPSFQATRNEKDSTRARANVLREFLTKSTKENPYDHKEIKEVMDLCLSCKACSTECPSNVDMSTMKAEFLYQYQKTNGSSFRSKVFANIDRLNGWNSLLPSVYNKIIRTKWSAKYMKRMLGIASARSFPSIEGSLYKWFQRNKSTFEISGIPVKEVYLFCDEFTKYNETSLGIKAIELLFSLGYQVRMLEHPESGRAAISKGFLDKAKKLANQQVEIFKNIITEETLLIGIEPSAILSFRDEYPRLVDEKYVESANRIKEHCLTIEEFISQEIKLDNITSDSFTDSEEKIILHGHCHQKAMTGTEHSIWMLELPTNFHVENIPSGCCGMAGSFGYEEEHYEVSQQIGEMVLFPAIRKIPTSTIIAASGTSCRHQIRDGTSKKALHPIEILHSALK